MLETSLHRTIPLAEKTSHNISLNFYVTATLIYQQISRTCECWANFQRKGKKVLHAMVEHSFTNCRHKRCCLHLHLWNHSDVVTVLCVCQTLSAINLMHHRKPVNWSKSQCFLPDSCADPFSHHINIKIAMHLHWVYFIISCKKFYGSSQC